MSLSVDGRLAGTFQGVASAPASPASATIGVDDPASGSGFWMGRLAEIRLWNRALTESEIAERRDDRLLGRELGLVGYWPLASLADGETVDLSPPVQYRPRARGLPCGAAAGTEDRRPRCGGLPLRRGIQRRRWRDLSRIL